MQRIYIAIICPLLILLAACSKDSSPALLPQGSISFKLPEGKDTIEMPLSILKDSAVVLKLQAAFTGSTSGNHWITFAIDTTKIRDYRAKFGQGILVPAPHYLFFKSNVRLSAGATESDTAQLNIGQQTKLMEYSTYVLPIVIQSVDGEPEGAASGRVIYFVFKTGKPLFINKQGWTIAAFTSQNGTNAPTGLLDENNLTTFWASNITQFMPQSVTINMNREVTFTGLNYYLPTVLNYPNLGGYPTSIKIETSMNGTTWTDKGTFAGNVSNNMQSILFGQTTARFVRFTALASVKYSNTYDAIFISGIGLLP